MPPDQRRGISEFRFQFPPDPRPRPAPESPGYIYTIPDPYDDHVQVLILHAGDDPIVAHPVFPEGAQSVTLEGLTDTPGVLPLVDSIMQKFQDPSCIRGTELVQLLFRSLVALNPPWQNAPSPPQAVRSRSDRHEYRSGVVLQDTGPPGPQGIPGSPGGQKGLGAPGSLGPVRRVARAVLILYSMEFELREVWNLSPEGSCPYLTVQAISARILHKETARPPLIRYNSVT